MLRDAIKLNAQKFDSKLNSSRERNCNSYTCLALSIASSDVIREVAIGLSEIGSKQYFQSQERFFM
jgi:hypothetical protein